MRDGWQGPKSLGDDGANRMAEAGNEAVVALCTSLNEGNFLLDAITVLHFRTGGREEIIRSIDSWWVTYIFIGIVKALIMAISIVVSRWGILTIAVEVLQNIVHGNYGEVDNSCEDSVGVGIPYVMSNVLERRHGRKRWENWQIRMADRKTRFAIVANYIETTIWLLVRDGHWEKAGTVPILKMGIYFGLSCR